VFAYQRCPACGLVLKDCSPVKEGEPFRGEWCPSCLRKDDRSVRTEPLLVGVSASRAATEATPVPGAG